MLFSIIFEEQTKKRRKEKREKGRKDWKTNHALDTEFADHLDTDADVHELVAEKGAVFCAVTSAELDEDGNVPFKVRDKDVIVLGADLDDGFDETLSKVSFCCFDLFDQLVDDVRDVAFVDHADEQIEGPHADRDVFVVETKDDNVLVFLHRLGVDLHDVVQRTQSQVFDCCFGRPFLVRIWFFLRRMKENEGE